MELRKRAFHQFYGEFEDHQFTLAAALVVFREGGCLPRARAQLFLGARSVALSRRRADRRLRRPDSSVRQNLAPLFRYYELRRRVLGLDELHQYDTYVPLVPEIETHVSFRRSDRARLSPRSRHSGRIRRGRSADGMRGPLVRSLRDERASGAARSLPAATALRPTS